MSAMRRQAATVAALCCVSVAGCGGDDEPDAPAAGGATATATAPATLPDAPPGTADTTTPGQTVPGAGGASPGASAQKRTADAVRECLAKQGYRATGGVRPPGTPNAPQYEILVAGPRGSAFIAFHRSLAGARRYEARVRRNAGRVKGATVERQGTITTVWVDLTDKPARERIRDCVRQQS